MTSNRSYIYDLFYGTGDCTSISGEKRPDTEIGFVRCLKPIKMGRCKCSMLIIPALKRN